MKQIEFYRTTTGICPVEDFLDCLDDKQVEKVLWVLKLIKELTIVPKQYLKKLVSTNDIWEIRVQSGNNIFRLLGFIHKGKLIILTNGFVKKTQKTPKNEIAIAEKRKKEYLDRSKNSNG